MVNGDRKKESLARDIYTKSENGHIYSSSFQTPIEKNLMETEGRGYSDLYRNSSEELFLKSLMDTSLAMPVPTMEMLGFKNLSHNFRTDSEELFKTWLTNGENHGPTSIAHRTRLASRRISTELTNFSGLPHVTPTIPQKKENNDILFAQNIPVTDDVTNDLSQHPMRVTVERGMQAWFHSSQPMTRSRSSELRKRYAAMQNPQSSMGIEANRLKQDFVNPNSFIDTSPCDIPNQLNTFMSPSNSSSSTFPNPLMGSVDNVTSVVSMLKGTLERKKLSNNVDKEAVDDSSFGFYDNHEVIMNNHIINEIPRSIQDVSGIQVNDSSMFQMVGGAMNMDFEGFVNPMNRVQLSTISQEPSQSESSAAAPVVSAGFDVCDGTSNSGQTISMCESSRKEMENGKSAENGSIPNGFRERIFKSNLKDDRKRRSLARLGSVTSADSGDKGDPTKKRRVERSRKMAEAKERNLTPAIPSDMQSIMKRCENLEKEVRSLKLNLAFMNRKDSEQTKQIEELQQQKDDLSGEKERLLEEIERILGEPSKL